MRRRVEQVARRRKCAASVVIRDAVSAYVEKEVPKLTPYELAKDFIGSVEGGDPKLSENTGRRFAEQLRTKAAKR